MRSLCLIFLFALTGAVSGAERRFDFGECPEGGVPTNFSAALFGGGAPGAWKVALTEVPSAFAPFTGSAPAFNHAKALTQANSDGTDERFPMLVYDGDIYRDFKFSSRFKIAGGVVEQMAGLVFRFQNASNFYVVRASALGKNIRFYKVVNGQRTDPIGPAINITTGVWHTLAVRCEGNQIYVYLDDQLIMPALGDNSFAEGKIGFWTKSDSVSYFADARVEYTPRIPVAQATVNAILEKQPRILGLRIYTLETNNTARILASKEPAEIGQPGTEAETKAIQDGTIWFGREKGAVLLTLPLHDRNGDIIAAVRIKLKSFFGETQDTALTRATIISKQIQERCLSADDLQK